MPSRSGPAKLVGGLVVFALAGCGDDQRDGGSDASIVTPDDGTVTSGTTGPEPTTSGPKDTTTGSGSGADETSDTGESTACRDGSAEATEICYFEAIDFAMGRAPSDVVVGDFDGDGAMDIATANAGSNDVSVRYGNGIGHLTVETTHPVGLSPSAIAAGDFDGDCDDDLATANAGDGTVSILIATRWSHDLAPHEIYAVGEVPADIVIADLIGIGDVDLVVGNRGSRDYHTLVADGLGGFVIHGPFGTGPEGVDVTGVAAASFGARADDLTDVFVAGGGRYASNPGNDDGTSDDTQTVVGDVDGDIVRVVAGLMDTDTGRGLVLVDQAGDRLLVLRGDPTAGFDTTEIFVGGAPSDVAVGDVSSDGVADLVVLRAEDDMVAILPADDHDAWGPPVTFEVGRGPSGVKLSDLDSDGVPDIIVSNRDSDDISVLLSAP